MTTMEELWMRAEGSGEGRGGGAGLDFFTAHSSGAEEEQLMDHPSCQQGATIKHLPAWERSREEASKASGTIITGSS